MMSVEFEENKPLDFNYQPEKKGLADLIIKLGLAKDKVGAEKVMIVIAIICFGLSIYFFLN
jgi:hypothetical protein